MRKLWIALMCVFPLLLSGLCMAQTATPAAPAPAGAAMPSPDLLKAADLIKQTETALAAMKDATFTFYRKEWKGKDYPQEKTFVKFRKNPVSVYMKWTGTEKTNQEVMWRKGWNDNELKAHKGSFPDITVNLDPKGSMAMDGSRHPITEAGFPHTIQIIAAMVKKLVANPSLGTVKDLGTQNVYGATAQCFEAKLDKAKDPSFYATAAEICLHTANKMPIKLKIWNKEGGKERLIEDYGYENVKVNVGLTDKDFDPENKEYKF